MTALPYMPLWTDAYIADTQHLTNEEHGVYLRLLMFAWRSRDRGLPDDDMRLARIVGMSAEEWSRVRDVILEFFTEEDGKLYQKRLSQEWVRVADIREKRSHAGRKGGMQSASKKKANGEAKTQHPYPDPDPYSESGKIRSPNGDSSAPPTDDLQVAADLYNRTAEQCGLSKVQILSASRKTKLRARLKECGGIEGWKAALEKVEASPFLRGEATDWRASFDFILQKSSFTRLMEGTYDGSSGKAGNGHHPSRSDSEATANILRGIRKAAFPEAPGPGQQGRSH